jgi:hypothetical protein
VYVLGRKSNGENGEERIELASLVLGVVRDFYGRGSLVQYDNIVVNGVLFPYWPHCLLLVIDEFSCIEDGI